MANKDESDLHGSDWFWAIAALLILLPAGIFILWNVGAAPPWQSQDTTSAKQALIESGVSIEVVELAQDCLTSDTVIGDSPVLDRDKLPLNCPAYPVAVGERWSGKIMLDRVNTINGKWSGSEPHVAMDDLGSVSGVRTHTDSWGSLTNPSQGWEEVWVEADFPPISADLLHREVTGQVDLTLKVPEVAGASTFQDVTTARERRFSLYVVTADELDLLAQTLPQNRWIALAVGALGLLLTCFGGLALFTITRQAMKAIQHRLR